MRMRKTKPMHRIDKWRVKRYLVAGLVGEGVAFVSSAEKLI